ncbi:MAG: hypothetical protein AAGA50_22855 [Pseudomonadota bacterium]
MSLLRQDLPDLISGHFLLSALVAGIAGQLAFELYAWAVSPLLFGVTLEPANLVAAISAKVSRVSLSYGPAFLVHLLIGTLGFIFVIIVARILTGFKYIWSGLLSGLALWFIAQGILAPFIGRSFMMGFGAYTQSSLVGHVGMCMVIGFMLDKFPADKRA